MKNWHSLLSRGNKRYYATLWEQTSRLIHKLIYKHASKRKLPNDIDFDDILQCGYFAMVNAVKAYTPEKDLKFNTYLEFQIMNAIQLTIDRGQRKGMNTPRLQEYSYNRTVSNSEGEEVEIIDLMPDKQSPKIYEGAELTDLQTLQWKRSPESYAIMQDIAERRRKGEYISYGKEQAIFLLAFTEYMQTHSEKSADTISDLYSCSYRFRESQRLNSHSIGRF